MVNNTKEVRVAHTNLSRSKVKIVTDLSKDPEASLRPSQLHPTEWTFDE
jgi:hypothetical protein